MKFNSRRFFAGAIALVMLLGFVATYGWAFFATWTAKGKP